MVYHQKYQHQCAMGQKFGLLTYKKELHLFLPVSVISISVRVRTGIVSCATLIGFDLFTGMDKDTGTDEQGQVKFLP